MEGMRQATKDLRALFDNIFKQYDRPGEHTDEDEAERLYRLGAKIGVIQAVMTMYAADAVATPPGMTDVAKETALHTMIELTAKDALNLGMSVYPAAETGRVDALEKCAKAIDTYYWREAHEQ